MNDQPDRSPYSFYKTILSADDPIRGPIERLGQIIGEMDSVLVAFSGGVDSALVLKIAHDVLGNRAAAATALSPALSSSEMEDSRRIAREIGVAHHVITSEAMDRPAFYQNGPQRCYACKKDLYAHAARLARTLGLRWLANGTNRDDLKDFRPGLKAAEDFGVRSPLVEAGLGKTEIRRMSRAVGLTNWDKPADACLSSRVPFGTIITMERLREIEQAEGILKEEGFRHVRVRHHDEIARIELPADDFSRWTDPALRDRVTAAIRKIGFRYVALDLQGYRQGSLNPEFQP